jgi:hypothetical protein
MFWVLALGAAGLVASCGGKSRAPPLNRDRAVPGSVGTPRCTEWKGLLSDCYDGYCANEGETTTFCECWTQSKDLDMRTCTCVPLDLDDACRYVNLENVDFSKFLCSDASSAVGNMCN